MDGEGWDVAGIRAAYEQELESICTAIRIAKARTIAAAVSDRAAALRLQLDELDELDARQASQRMQHSIYRAMLSDVPILDQQAPSSAGQRGQAVSGKIPRHGYENVRVNSNGSTQLKEYIDHLRSAEEPPKQCYACMEAKQCLQGVTLDGCDHFWCHKCLRRRFNLATKNEGSYPVRCCMQLPNIPMDNPAVAAVLGNKLIIDLKAKIIEYETLDRTYCYKQTCSTFIPPDQILERMAPCPACNRKTCAECKARYHKSPNCTTVNDEAFDEWRTETRAATCPGCNHVIVISYGCNHMRYSFSRPFFKFLQDQLLTTSAH